MKDNFKWQTKKAVVATFLLVVVCMSLLIWNMDDIKQLQIEVENQKIQIDSLQRIKYK